MNKARLALLGATGVATLLVTTSVAGAATFESTVDITSELGVRDLQARTFANTATVGAGAELDLTHEVANPDVLTGAVEVDIDPDSDSITVTWAERDDCYSYIEVTISSAEIGSVTLDSDALFSEAPPTVVVDSADGIVTMLWGTKGDTGCYDGAVGNTAVFSFTNAEPTSTTDGPEPTVPVTLVLSPELPSTGSGSSQSTSLMVALLAIVLGAGAVRLTRRSASR
jgi:LPXTG-motif cell wall-anchored protein